MSDVGKNTLNKGYVSVKCSSRHTACSCLKMQPISE